MNDSGKIVVLDFSMLHPRRKITQFSVVAIVGHPHLRPDVENLVVVYDYSAVVNDVFVYDGPTFNVYDQHGEDR